MVQTCPHCGKRIVACSMCRASEDTEHNYCTHCCLDYQARVENQEANWQYKGYKIVLEDEEMIDDNGNSIGMGYRACVECPDGDVKTSGLVFAQEKDARIEAEDMIDEMNEDESDEPEVQPQAQDEQAPVTDITKYIKPGVTLYDVICHWTEDRGGEEYFALYDLENEKDFGFFYEKYGFKTLEYKDLSRYWFDGLDKRYKDGPQPASGADMVRLINTEVLDRIREERENGDDVDYLWDQVFDMDGDVWDQVLGIRPEKAEDKPELAEKPKEPFIVMTREMSLLGETIQDITLSAWPIVWDNNKYDQDSREVLEMLRDWAVEFENWWYGHDQDWRDANCWSIEVEDYTIRKSKEYVKELQERISK